jgi:hypothetical protein
MCSLDEFELDDESHVLLVRQFGLLAQPQAVVDGEGVDGDRQVLRVDLGELFAAGVVPETVTDDLDEGSGQACDHYFGRLWVKRLAFS